MIRNCQLKRILLGIVALYSNFSFAAVPRYLDGPPSQSITEQFIFSFPSASKNLTKTPNGLKFLKEHTDSQSVSHFRMQQEYYGLKVFGGYVIFHQKQPAYSSMQMAQTELANGVIYEGLFEDLGIPSKTLFDGAEEVLNEFVNHKLNKQPLDSQVKPIIYVDHAYQAHFAYEIHLKLQSTQHGPERLSVILDAYSHEPYYQWNNLKTITKKAQGYGLGGNERFGAVHYNGNDFPTLNITRDTSKLECYMENSSIKVVNMQQKIEGPDLSFTFPCQKSISKFSDIYWTGIYQNGFDEANGAYSVSNDAFYAGTVVKQLFQSWYKTEVLTNDDDTPMKLILRVHYGQDYENAFWEDGAMTFGDGGDTLYPFTTLDITAHEIGHGFTEQYSNLYYFEQAGAINEAFSDMLAQVAEFYAYGKNDWRIGGTLLKSGYPDEAMRYMDLPSRDGMSIDSAKFYRKGMDVHYSSGAYNRLFYLLSGRPGWGIRKAFDVMVKANMDYWTPLTSFESGACGILSAARDLRYPLVDIKGVLEKVAIDYNRCGAVA